MGKSQKGDSDHTTSSFMEKRSFGKPPGSSTSTGQSEIKSELFTKIGTRSALITARYEYVRPDVINSPLNIENPVVQTTGSSSDCTNLRIKHATITENPPEIIYDVPRCINKSVSNSK